MGTIYKITNKINNKTYVGQTTNFERRKSDHFAKWQRFHSKEFQEDINKYGKENFEIEILEELPDDCTREKLRERELFYIHSINPKYNTLGKERPEDTRRKLSKANIGKIQSDETKAKRKESIRIRHLTKPQLNEGHFKRVRTDEREFKSIKECAEYYGLKPVTVSKAIKRNGKIKKHKVWLVV